MRGRDKEREREREDCNLFQRYYKLFECSCSDLCPGQLEKKKKKDFFSF